MAEDLEVGVLLKPKNNLEDDVQDQELAVGGDGGGDLTPGQQQQQEGILAGGVSKGIAAAGIFGALLSQLKSVTGIIEAVFGTLSRALLPAVEVIAELIRPLVSGVNEFINTPQQIVENIRNTTLEDTVRGAAGLEEGETLFQNRNNNNSNNSPVNSGVTPREFLNFSGPESADQTGEVSAQKFLDSFSEPNRDKAGNFQ